MWKKVPKEQEPELLKVAIEFTSDHIRYGESMGEVIYLWKNTMLNTLTNVSVNRKAFLGHCAVHFKINVPEYITRIAWGFLTEEQRILANKEAEKWIKNWLVKHEEQNRKIYKGLGEQMLLQWPA